MRCKTVCLYHNYIKTVEAIYTKFYTSIAKVLEIIIVPVQIFTRAYFTLIFLKFKSTGPYARNFITSWRSLLVI